MLLQGTGGVSIFGLQIATLRGATTIITSSSDEKLDRARELGANHTINYRTTPDWAKAVRDLTGGSGATHIVEVGGSGTFPFSLRAAAFAGKVYVIGVLTAPGEPLDIGPILRGSLDVRGVLVGSVRMLHDLAQTFSSAGTHPVVDRTFPFTEAREALRYMQSGAHFGKVAIALP